MAELLKIEVTRSELEKGIIPANHVLCHMYYTSEGAKTRAGIIYGINTDLIYADSDNPDDESSHAADMAEVSLVVVKCPEKLYFNPKDDKSMPWETTMELKIGDTVWTNTIEALNAVTLVCEGEFYKILPYQDLYCARRYVKENSIPELWTIMLNGYVLCSQIHKESTHVLDVTSKDKIDLTRGIVEFLGKPNKRYLNPEVYDFLPLEKGDEVLFNKKSPPFLLERQKFSSKFDSEKLYWVVQRRNINAVLNRGA
jgi:hypothetical protein